MAADYNQPKAESNGAETRVMQALPANARVDLDAPGIAG